MILRRLIEHVRTQNWTAIVLDFVIVVLGVFMGIQLGNWNDARAEDAEGTRYVSQLTQEYAIVQDVVEDQVASYIEFTKAVQEALRLLTAEQMPQSADLAPLLNVALSGRIPPGEPAALRELVSAGKLDLIKNSELRKALVVALNTSDLTSHAFDLLRADLLDLNHALMKYMEYDLGPDFTDAETRRDLQSLSSIDVEGLRNDPEAMAALKIYLGAQVNMLGLERQYLEGLRDLNDILISEQAELQ